MGFSWYDAAWTKVKECLVDGALIGDGVSGTVTYSRVLISITDAEIAAAAQADGDDILFCDSDGLTKLKHDLVSYNSGTGELVAWVLVPSMAAGTDYQVWLYYGNAGCAAQEDKAGTWSTAAEKKATVVLHMEGDLVDSSGNSNDGTDQGTGSDTGKVGLCRSFDTSNWFTMAAAGFYAVQTQEYVSVGAWIKASSSGTGRQTIMVKGNAGSEVLNLYMDETGAIVFSDYYAADWFYYAVGDEDLRDDAWHRVWGVRSGNVMKVYVDGIDATAVSTGGLETIIRTEDVYAGGRLNADYRFYGLIDELMVVEEAMAAGDILTDFNSTDDPALFVTVSAEKTFVESSMLIPVDPLEGIEQDIEMPWCLLESTAARLMPYTGLYQVDQIQAIPFAPSPLVEIESGLGLPTSVLQGVAALIRLWPSVAMRVEVVGGLPTPTMEEVESPRSLPVWPRQERADGLELPLSVLDEMWQPLDMPVSDSEVVEAGTMVPVAWRGTVERGAQISASWLQGLSVEWTIPVMVREPVQGSRRAPIGIMDGVRAGRRIPAPVMAWIEAARILAASVAGEIIGSREMPIHAAETVQASATAPISALGRADSSVAASLLLRQGVEAERDLPCALGAIIASDEAIPMAVLGGMSAAVELPTTELGGVAVVVGVHALVLESIIQSLNIPASIGQELEPTPVSAARMMPVVVLRGVEAGTDLNATVEAVVEALRSMPAEWWDEVKQKTVAGEYVLMNLTPKRRLEAMNDGDLLRRTRTLAEAES